MPEKRIRYETLERCVHGNQAFRCTQCGYKRKRCQHDKLKDHCKKCKRITQRAKQAKKRKGPTPPVKQVKPRCEHGIIKYNCTKCGCRMQLCDHGVVKYTCSLCKRRYRQRAKAKKAEQHAEKHDEGVDTYEDIWEHAQDLAVQDLDDLTGVEEVLVLDD
jgi:hypothetical protein